MPGQKNSSAKETVDKHRISSKFLKLKLKVKNIFRMGLIFHVGLGWVDLSYYKIILVFLYSRTSQLCLELKTLWFGLGVCLKRFLNSIQVDLHLLLWLHSSILLI